MPRSRPPAAYRAFLAHVHDAGYGDFANASAPWLLGEVAKSQAARAGGLVVDLGCGSGIWAKALLQAGYDVLGYDLSSDMLAIACRRAKLARFEQASFLDAVIPPCVAVTALGEVFNYLFDQRNALGRLGQLFRRVHDSLAPGAVFIFDIATPGRVPGRVRESFRNAADWTCLTRATEDSARKRLTREITVFRRVGRTYRRDDEVHRLLLYERGEILDALRSAGFRVRTVANYGHERPWSGFCGFVARKK